MKAVLDNILKQNSLTIHSAEVILDGRLLLHSCYGEDRRYSVYSAAKSVTSAAFSLACDDGLLSPEEPLYLHLEERYRGLCSEDFKALPFSRFLTMTAGKYPFRPQGSNWTEYILSLPTDHSDTGFNYSNIPAYLVGEAVENAVGGDLPGYLEERLFAPLGIAMPPYQKSPEGHFYGATGMELTVHELALLGQLYLQKGSFGGRRIISEKSISQATSPIADTGSGDSYGFFFRIAGDHFSMVGKWGQRCMIYPEKRLVLAYLSHQPDRSEELYSAMKQFADSIR